MDLFKNLPPSNSTCNNHLSEIDFSKLAVSLDLLSISLSQGTPIPIGGRGNHMKNPDRTRSVSLCSNLSFSDHQTYSSGSDSDNNELLDIEQPKLPTAQQEALENLIKVSESDFFSKQCQFSLQNVKNCSQLLKNKIFYHLHQGFECHALSNKASRPC